MIRHLAGRLGQAIVATFGVLTIVFFIMRLSAILLCCWSRKARLPSRLLSYPTHLASPIRC
jgi:hypothetical protein